MRQPIVARRVVVCADDRLIYMAADTQLAQLRPLVVQAGIEFELLTA
jgi:hypothetical protein